MARWKRKTPEVILRGPIFQAEWDAYHKREGQLAVAIKAPKHPAPRAAPRATPANLATLLPSIPGDDVQAKAA